MTRADDPPAPKDFDRVVYDFRDASVPPRFHRSYTVTLGKEQGTIRISDYSSTLLEQQFPVGADRWQELTRAAGVLGEEGQSIARGATGTRTYTIELSRSGQVMHRFVWDSLSPPKATTMAFVELVRSTVAPPIETLVEKTRTP